jgi:hypothetical protein
MAWIITTTAPHMRASQLAAWADAQLWLAAKAAHKANPEALHLLPESILQSLHGSRSPPMGLALSD